jgi:hypothetical protein
MERLKGIFVARLAAIPAFFALVLLGCSDDDVKTKECELCDSFYDACLDEAKNTTDLIACGTEKESCYRQYTCLGNIRESCTWCNKFNRDCLSSAQNSDDRIVCDYVAQNCKNTYNCNVSR